MNSQQAALALMHVQSITEMPEVRRQCKQIKWMQAMPFTCPTTHSGEWGFQDVNSL